MKKYFYLLLVSLIALSCVDEEERGSNLKEGETVNVDLDLYLPVPSALSTRAITSKEEAKVETLKVLVFDNSGNYLADQSRDVNVADKAQTTDENGGSKLTVRVPLKITKSNVSIVVLANVVNEGTSGAPDYLTSIPAIKNTDKKSDYLRILDFSLGAGAKWNATSTEDYRRFPMWGEVSQPVTADLITIDLLRALARVNVMIAPEVSNFKLTSVQVHNSSKGGRIVSDYPSINSDGNVSGVSKPTLSKYGDNDNLVYKDAEIVENVCVNQIYIPEAAASSVKGDAYDGVYLTIGGTINNVQKLYRVYITNTGKNDGELLPILRNHTYKVNVTKVGEGLNDITVTIEDWNEVSIRSPYEQNTLTVSDNLFVFKAAGEWGGNTGVQEHVLDITSTWGEWSIVNAKQDGFKLTEDHINNKVIITATNLNGVAEGYFYVQSGELQKKIVVQIEPGETSNSYIRGVSGTYPLCVVVKGNGMAGRVADGVELATVDNLKLKPTKIGIIWETTKGLVTLKDGKTVFDVPSTDFSGVINYTVNLEAVDSNGDAKSGGNALIGAFNDKNECIWSWHIWIVPEWGIPNSDKLNIRVDTWKNTDKINYVFIDRNLGALTNVPGDVNSLGLLYQWGRKDPFIGPENIPTSQQRHTSLNSRKTTNYDPCNVGENPYWWDIYTPDRGNTYLGDTYNSLEYTIKHPTIVIRKGLCKEGIPQSYWGTKSGMSMVGNDDNQTAVNEGNKTIYDPCPLGYRVPPVLAFIFGSGKSSNYYVNYKSNNTYVGQDGYQQSRQYGFWMNLATSSRPAVSTSTRADDKITWLPITGVYDPNVNLSQAYGNQFLGFAQLDKMPSVTVNSILWTNTPIGIKDNAGSKADFRPGALFLHGRTSSTQGDHFHAINETGGSGSSTGANSELYAQTQQAGSVRCVRISEAQDFTTMESFPETVTIGKSAGNSKTEEIIVINGNWEVTNPGAPWFYLNKYSGTANGGEKQLLVFTASESNAGNERSAVLKIKTKYGTHDIKVIQEGVNTTKENKVEYQSKNKWNKFKSGDTYVVAEEKTIRITSIGDWTAELSNNNYRISSNSGGAGTQELTITAKGNSDSNLTIEFANKTSIKIKLKPWND